MEPRDKDREHQGQNLPATVFVYTADSHYLKLAYLEQPLISKWKSCPCLNMKIKQQVKNIVE